ncbi:MAG: transcriptional repressor LexA [Thermoanaerobaculales bacterium]|jgi:repressor LexA|nr:transcriptional repressor LexA [Thermoanaerobaculales bacterium]
MTYLTERQRDVLGFIEKQIDGNGVAPTLREISEKFGFASTASAQKHIALLERKGFLRREKHQKRGLVLAQRSFPTSPSEAELPLLGLVAAGVPIESVPDPEPVSVPPDFLGAGDRFVLKVRGESMIEDGIHDGDLVVVQGSSQAADGDMVVALVDGEVTLKRLFREPPATIRLQPANAEMEPIFAPAGSVTIQGVVVGLLRRY